MKKIKNEPFCRVEEIFGDAEINWDITSLEGIALISAIKACHQYLSDSFFTVYTDHESLIQLRNTRNKSGRMFRWAFLLQEYNYYVFKHKSGKTNHVDALSRIPHPPESPQEEASHCNDDEYDKIRVIAGNAAENSNQTTNFAEGSSSIEAGDMDYVKIHDHVEITLNYQTQNDSDIITDTPNHNQNTRVNSDKVAAIVNLALIQRTCPDLKRFFEYLEDNTLTENDTLARKTRFEV